MSEVKFSVEDVMQHLRPNQDSNELLDSSIQTRLQMLAGMMATDSSIIMNPKFINAIDKLLTSNDRIALSRLRMAQEENNNDRAQEVLQAFLAIQAERTAQGIPTQPIPSTCERVVPRPELEDLSADDFEYAEGEFTIGDDIYLGDAPTVQQHKDSDE